MKVRSMGPELKYVSEDGVDMFMAAVPKAMLTCHGGDIGLSAILNVERAVSRPLPADSHVDVAWLRRAAQVLVDTHYGAGSFVVDSSGIDLDKLISGDNARVPVSVRMHEITGLDLLTEAVTDDAT